jgi:hypothetical protein
MSYEHAWRMSHPVEGGNMYELKFKGRESSEKAQEACL